MTSKFFESDTPHFFKVILQDDIRNGNLRIPSKFVRKHGSTLSDLVHLKVPSGFVWEMQLHKNKEDILIQDGWAEFMKHYRISHGSFVVFRYEGQSQFCVAVFDLTACEIEYPVEPVGHTKCNNLANQPSSTPEKEKTREKEIQVIDLSSDDDIQPLDNGKEKKQRLHCPQPLKKMRRTRLQVIGRSLEVEFQTSSKELDGARTADDQLVHGLPANPSGIIVSGLPETRHSTIMELQTTSKKLDDAKIEYPIEPVGCTTCNNLANQPSSIPESEKTKEREIPVIDLSGDDDIELLNNGKEKMHPLHCNQPLRMTRRTRLQAIRHSSEMDFQTSSKELDGAGTIGNQLVRGLRVIPSGIMVNGLPAIRRSMKMELQTSSKEFDGGRKHGNEKVNGLPPGTCSSEMEFQTSNGELEGARTSGTAVGCFRRKKRKMSISYIEDLEGSEAVSRALSFHYGRPSFVVLPSFVFSEYYLYLPRKFVNTHIPGIKDSRYINLCIPGIKTWAVRFQDGGGWEEFLVDNDLRVGDVCLFELMGRAEVTYRAVIFRVRGVAQSSPLLTKERLAFDKTTTGESVYWECLSRLDDVKLSEVEDEVRKKYPSFQVVLNKSCAENGLTVPSSFRVDHLLQGQGEAAFDVTLNVSGESWRVGLTTRGPSGNWLCLSRGWRLFARGNGLQVGDICKFELVDKNDVVFNVFILKNVGA